MCSIPRRIPWARNTFGLAADPVRPARDTAGDSDLRAGGTYVLAKWRGFMLARRRAGYGVDTFVGQLQGEGLDPAVARAVYEYLRKVQKVTFPMMPDDTLDEKPGFAGRNLQKAINEIILRAGREGRPGLIVGPPETIRDLVRYVEVSPRVGPEGRVQKTPSGTFQRQRDDVRSAHIEPKASGR